MRVHPLTLAIAFLTPVFAFCAWDMGLIAFPMVAVSLIPLAFILAL